MSRQFIRVEVILTEPEAEGLRREAIRLGEGTLGAAIRKRLGWPEVAYGLQVARKRAAKEAEA